MGDHAIGTLLEITVPKGADGGSYKCGMAGFPLREVVGFATSKVDGPTIERRVLEFNKDREGSAEKGSQFGNTMEHGFHVHQQQLSSIF